MSAICILAGERNFPVTGIPGGVVRVVDVMGDDDAVVQSARVSYGAGTKTVREDAALISYLVNHDHMSPFEMCELKLHVRAPMDVWRQWIRHRTASVNEASTRYSVVDTEFYVTPPGTWRRQSTLSKQGSDGLVAEDVGVLLSMREKTLHKLAKEVYEERILAGVAREQARKDLPLSTFTEAYWKMDLRNLLHFLQLRMHSSAQYEIRMYANCIAGIVARWVPHTWEAFMQKETKDV